ncbi:MAG: hypothetical protein E7376_05115 [Clostridiales bacterium]|nr:hypothetical protein [Clostridiales bacterium]
MSLYNEDERYRLSNIVWVKVEKLQKGKKVFILVPFSVCKGNRTITRNVLNNINYVKKPETPIAEHLRGACKHTYNADSVFELVKPVEFRDPDGFAPHVFQTYLPKSFVKKHLKEYEETAEMIVTTTEVRNLSKYLSKKEQQLHEQLQAEQARF